jgi:protein TonB
METTMNKAFKISLGTAFFLHFLFLGYLAVEFHTSVIEVPSKVIHVKLGKQPHPSAGATKVNQDAPAPQPKPITKAPVMQPQEIVPKPPEKKPTPKPKPHTTVPIQNTAPTPSRDPELKPQKQATTPQPVPPTPKPKEVAKPEPTPEPTPPRKTETEVQQFAPPPKLSSDQDSPFVEHFNENATKPFAKNEISGNELGNRTDSSQQMILSYEQQIGLWLERHKIYPMSARRKGLEGQVLLRLQIDQMGNLRYVEVAEETGHPMLDSAALQMARRADPFPPMPQGFTSNAVEQFVIGINYFMREEEREAMGLPPSSANPTN